MTELAQISVNEKKPTSTGIYASIAAIMSDVDYISKSQKNSQQGFMFRGIDDIYNSLHKLFAKHGVITVPKVLSKNREERKTSKGGTLAFTCLTMEYTFYALDGSSISCVVEGEGMDSGDKSSNKAMAVAHKYALLQVLMIPTDEIKDPDAESHEIVQEHVGNVIEYADLYIGGQEDVTFEFMELWGMLDKELQASVFNGFPKGKVTKYKNAVREMETHFNNACVLAAGNINEAMAEYDSHKALESWNDFGEFGKRIVWNHLNEHEQHFIKEVKENAK